MMWKYQESETDFVKYLSALMSQEMGGGGLRDNFRIFFTIFSSFAKSISNRSFFIENKKKFGLKFQPEFVRALFVISCHVPI